jgi:hypothetical protein
MTCGGADVEAEISRRVLDRHGGVGVSILDALAYSLELFFIERNEHLFGPVDAHAAATRIGAQQSQDLGAMGWPACRGNRSIIRKGIGVRGINLLELAQQFVRTCREEKR